MNKTDLRQAILRQLRTELDRQAAAASASRDEAISEESRAENKWDTHSQEAAYLAEGQSRLVAEIAEGLAHYAAMPLPDFGAGDAIALGALVELEAARGGAHSWYFLGPRAGGIEVELGGHAVLVLTPQSPLGRQLLGRRAGDTVVGPGRGAAATQRIVSVR
ncbi:MAG: GreA/GreB family elongation factor [Opitutaceae bacterium]|nr:GreA/GreB family elongation factor [Opitutaceae bacterium]